jgi:hypothetical protein
MSRILKNKKALATVVTTLIILVVAVLLATVVTFYAVNITTNRMQQEDLYMSNLHVWYNTTGGWAEAAFVLINTGGRDVVLQSITARSQPSAWTNVFYNTSNTWTVNNLSPTTMPLNSTSGFTTAPITGMYGTPSKSATSVMLTNASTKTSSAITLRSGYTLVVYIMHPDSIGQNDVGTACDVTVFTANAQWTQESNVQASQ